MEKMEATTINLDPIVSALKAATVFSCDAETTGFDPRKDKIKGIGLSVGEAKGETWWLPFHGAGAVSQVQTFRALAPVFSDPEKLWVNSNPKFDWKFFDKNGLRVGCKVACTVVASWITNENSPSHGLKEQVEREFGQKLATYEEAIQHEHDLFGNEKWLQYVHDDPFWARKLWLEKLVPRLKEQGLEKLYWSVEMEVLRILVEMELTGVGIDLEYLAKLKVRVEKEMVEAKEKAFKMLGHPVNIDSPVEISKLLFNELEIKPLPGMERGKNGFYSTADDWLSKYPKGAHPILDVVMDYRHAAHTLGTFVTPYLERTRDEARIFAEFNQAGTVASRFTSSSPNLQQIPTEKGYVKKMFVSGEGKSFAVGDWNQLQFRLIGHFALRWLGKSAIAEAYFAGKDLHQKTMEELGFNKLIPDKSQARRRAKIVNFSFLFGRGWKGFAEAENFDPDTAKGYYTGFHKAYPEIRLCANKCRRDICSKGYVLSLLERRRRFPHCIGLDSSPDNRDSAAWWDGYKAWNSTIQMAESDLVRLTMRNFYREIVDRRKTDKRWLDVHPLIQVHDELVAEAPDEIVQEVAERMKWHAENALKLDVPILMEVGTAKDWESAKH